MIHSQVLLYGNETWFSRIVHRRFIIAIFVLGGEGEEEGAWDFYYRGRDFPIGKSFRGENLSLGYFGGGWGGSVL